MVKFDKIDWIFFDIGSTLVDESEAYAQRVKETVIGTSVSATDFTQVMTAFSQKGLPGSKLAAQHFGLRLAPWPSEKELLYPDCKATLDSLSKKFKLGIIVNQKLGTTVRLRERGLLGYFGLIVASAEEGVAKPDPKIFQLALSRAACQPKNALMVGDRLDNDIVPAKQLGMHTIWIRQGIGGLAEVQSRTEEADFTVNSLTELTEILEKYEI